MGCGCDVPWLGAARANQGRAAMLSVEWLQRTVQLTRDASLTGREVMRPPDSGQGMDASHRSQAQCQVRLLRPSARR